MQKKIESIPRLNILKGMQQGYENFTFLLSRCASERDRRLTYDPSPTELDRFNTRFSYEPYRKDRRTRRLDEVELSRPPPAQTFA